MVNYYEILGVPENASPAEIKAAFRKLAKLFHPDKNPNGQEQFRKIRKAYEILGNPALRRSYDLKLKYHRNSNIRSTNKKSGTKNWSFDEKELKRRRYYEEHIKKHAKANPIPKVNPNEIKTNYNEYKYILYATPLAVALFLVVINMATGSKPTFENSNVETPLAEKTGFKLGDSPFLDRFGKMQYNIKTKETLTLKNQSGNDVVVVLFNEKEFIRSAFIADGYSAEISQLPGKKISLRFASGRSWNNDRSVTSDKKFYKNDLPFELNSSNELTLVNGNNEGFSEISEQKFFEREIYD